MKKEMFKKVKAVILSVFMLGIVLFQLTDAVPVMAADSLFSGPSDEHYSSIKNISSLNDYIGLSGENALTSNDFIFVSEINNDLYVYAMRKVDSEKRNVRISNTFYFYLDQFVNLRGYATSEPDTSLENFEYKYLYFYVDSQDNYRKCQVTGNGRDTFWVEQRINTSSNRFEINRTFSAKITSDAHVVRLIFSNASSLACNGTNYNTGFSGVLGDIKYTASDDECGFGDFISGGSGGSSGSYDESNASYKRNLGYLQGMSKKTIMLYGDNASQDTNSAKYKFSYAKTSNSGFNLTQDDVYIRLYAQVAVYDKHGKGENIMVNMPKTFVGQYEASPLSLTVSAMDIFNANSDVWSQINTASWQWKTVLHGYQRMDKLYFQIVAKNPDGTWSYGGYTTLNDKVSSNGEQVTVVGTQTPDGGKDIDYAYNENISSSAGVGSTYKDAEANADANASGDGGFKLTGFNGLVEIFNSFKDGLSSFAYAFGDFPELIAKTFPFLPAFITSAISLGFLVAVVLRLLGR